MNVQETTEIRELTSDELDDVNGGFIFAAAAAFVGGYVAGRAIRSAGDWVRDYFANS
jgi:lactobin A/cerein 7B family class IIb bacteriocin